MTTSAPATLPAQPHKTPDGIVNTFDLLAVLANWGTADHGADIATPDNIVNVFDLLEVLATWNCRIGNIPEALTLEQEVTGAGLTMNDWDDYQATMTDPQTSGKVKENYNCWMTNYLTGCSVCPPCPDKNPFE